MQDATGNTGGSLVLSTSAGGSTSSSAEQPVDRLTIDSSGLATFSGGVILANPSSTLTAAGSTLLGSSASQTLIVNAVTTFASTATITANAALTANAAVSVTAGNAFRALGNTVLGTSSSNTLSVNSATTFASGASITANAAVIANAPITANAAVSVTASNLFSALGSTVLGSSGGSNTLTVNAVTTFASTAPITANAALTASGNVVLGASGSQTLTVNAVTSFASTAPITANGALTANAAATVAGLLTANGNTVLGSTSSSQTLTVNAVTIFASTAPITANAAVSIANGNLFSAFGNAVLGTSSSNTLTVNSATTFASGASIIANAAITATALFTASANTIIGSSSSQTLTVAATSSFSAPVAINAAATVTGLATLSGGAALTFPVTVNNVPLARVATSANYTDLNSQPRVYSASSSVTATAGAARLLANVSSWYGTVSVGQNNNGQATVNPTLDGTSTGAALFNSILSVQTTVVVNSGSGTGYAVLTAVTLPSITLTAYSYGTSALGGSAQTYAASNTLIMVQVVGTYSS